MEILTIYGVIRSRMFVVDCVGVVTQKQVYNIEVDAGGMLSPDHVVKVVDIGSY